MHLFKSLVDMGMARLGRGLIEVNTYYQDRPLAAPMAVLDCIAGAENLIRGRILETIEYDATQKVRSTEDLIVQQLLVGSRKYSFQLLPEELKLASKYEMKNVERYQEFGLLRTRLFKKLFEQSELIELTYRFCYEVIEPVAFHFYEEQILNHVPGKNKDELHEEVHGYWQAFGISPEYEMLENEE